MTRQCIFHVMLLALFLFWKRAYAIHEDQDGLYDWHQQYVGRVKLAEFYSSGQRKRVYVVTEKNVLASLSLRTGEMIWRQVVGGDDPITALHASSRYVTTLSSNGKNLRAWSVVDGALVWETFLPSSLGSEWSVEFIPLPGEGASSGEFLVLSGEKVFRIAGSTGKILWSTPVQADKILLAREQVLAVSLLKNGGFVSGVKQTTFSHSTGEKIRETTISIPVQTLQSNILITSDNILALSPEASAIYALSITTEGSWFKELNVKDLDLSKAVRLSPVTLSTGFGVEFDGFSAVVGFVGNENLKILARFETGAVMSDALAVDGSKFVFSVFQQKEGSSMVEMKVLDLAGEIEPSSEAFVNLPPHRGSVQKVFLNSYSRKEGSNFGYRFLAISQDDSMSLIQQGSIVWQREEALASVVKAQIVDLPVATEGLTAGAIEHSLEEWLKKQWLKTKKILNVANATELDMVRDAELNSWAKNAPNRDHNGFRKLILALTTSGKLFGLHSGDGRTLFSSLLPSLSSSKVLDFFPLKEQIGKQHRSPKLLILARNTCATSNQRHTCPAEGSVVAVTVDGHSGEELASEVLNYGISLTLRLPVVAKDGKQPLLFVDENWREGPPLVHIFPPTDTAVEAVQSRSTSEIVFFLVDKVAGHVSGFVLGKEKYGDRFSYESIEIWRTAFPEASEKVAAVASRRAEEATHTQTRPKPDRTVQYKFLSHNLLFLATVSVPPNPEPQSADVTVNPEERSLVAHIIDTVSGRILHRVTHPSCGGDVQAVFSDNWIVYHYFNFKFHRFEMTVLELYDQSEHASAVDILRYSLGLGGPHLSSPLSSLSPGILNLEVQSQSYFFSHSVKTMAVTSTARGITSKQILVGLSGGQILALEKRLLDPRRTLAPSQQDKEEGIIPYTEALPISPFAYVTHGVPVEGLEKIITEPSRLESTTLIFAHGIDLFYLRTAPSRTFDTLSEDFSYVLLLVTIAALIVAIGVSYYLGERRELKLKWK